LLRITDAPSVQTFADLLQSNFWEPTHLAPNLYNILRTLADRLQSNFGNRRSLRLTCTILWEHLQTYCNPTNRRTLRLTYTVFLGNICRHTAIQRDWHCKDFDQVHPWQHCPSSSPSGRDVLLFPDHLGSIAAHCFIHRTYHSTLKCQVRPRAFKKLSGLLPQIRPNCLNLTHRLPCYSAPSSRTFGKGTFFLVIQSLSDLTPTAFELFHVPFFWANKIRSPTFVFSCHWTPVVDWLHVWH